MAVVITPLLRVEWGAEYCDERVCLSVCLCTCSHTFKTKFPVHVARGRSACGQRSVLFCRARCSVMYCTSGFLDDVMFSYYGMGVSQATAAASLRRRARANSLVAWYTGCVRLKCNLWQLATSFGLRARV